MMRIPKFRRCALICLVALVGLFLWACTVRQLPVYDIELTLVHAKLDLPVELVIHDEFRDPRFGDNLANLAQNLTKNVFSQPLLRDENGKGEPTWPARRFTLEPKIVFINEPVPMTAFSDLRQLIIIEWKLSKITGEPVWIETVQGESVGQAGNMFNGEIKLKERVQKIFQDLFDKSQETMLNSQVLRKLR